MFIGAVIGRRYMVRRFGLEHWRSYAPVLMAGYGCGFGLVSMVCIAVKLISASVSSTAF